MVSIVNSQVRYQPITEEIQSLVIALITQKTMGIVMDVLQVLISSASLTPQEIVAKHIAPREIELSKLDVRTAKLMLNILNSVNEEINKLPGTGIATKFSGLATNTGDPQVREKLIRSLALDQVKFIVQTLDTMNPDIVNRLIKPATPPAVPTAKL